MPKLIREIRMGPPKTWKTGAVVSTYPRPLLCLQGDEGGLDIVKDPITWIDQSKFADFCKLPQSSLPPLSAVQFAKSTNKLNELFGPVGETDTLHRFTETFNNLFLIGCPWKTVVLDPITVVSDFVLSAFAATNAKKMEDARKWAGNVGVKVTQIISTFFTLKCHVVCIMHTATNRIVNEKGETISETSDPVLFSKQRDILGKIPSQFFYQDCLTVSGQRKPFILTVADSRVKGIGARWPDLPARIEPPTFDAIYGKAVASGETTK